VQQRQIGGWRGEATCPEDHRVPVTFTLPDYGDAPSLFQCPECSELVSVDPSAEQYIGPAWDQMRDGSSCPGCGDALGHARLYPDHFRCPECGSVGTFEPPATYSPDEMRTLIAAWDPYVEPEE